MARQVRIEYAGAVYHVMARGNQGRPIFADDLDRKSWLNTLGQACEKTGWRIDAWVWMRNHYHLLKLIQAALGEGRAASYAGAAKRAHGEAEAERWLGAGLKALGLEAGSLPERPKGLAEKQVLAWWLRGRTTMGRRWISERLGMGEESGVSRAVRKVQVGREGKLRTLKRRLLAEAGNQSQNAIAP